jgi:hypothetical protein
MFKWKQIDRIVQVGYEASKELLADWARSQSRIMTAGHGAQKGDAA